MFGSSVKKIEKWIDNNQIDKILKVLNTSKDKKVLRAAIEALSSEPRAIEPLVKIHDANGELSQDAYWALQKICKRLLDTLSDITQTSIQNQQQQDYVKALPGVIKIMKDAAHEPLLEGILNYNVDYSPTARSYCIAIAQVLNVPDAIGHTARSLYSGDPLVSGTVLEVLPKYGDAAIEPLIETLDGNTHSYVFEVLKRIGTPKAVEQIEKSLVRSDNEEIATVAARFLFDNGWRPTKIKTLVHLLTASDNEILDFAKESMVELKDKSTNALAKLFNEETLTTRFYTQARDVLLAIGTEKAYQTLMMLLDDFACDDNVKKETLTALINSNWRPKDAEKAVEMLIEGKRYRECVQYGKVAATKLVDLLDNKHNAKVVEVLKDMGHDAMMVVASEINLSYATKDGQKLVLEMLEKYFTHNDIKELYPVLIVDGDFKSLPDETKKRIVAVFAPFKDDVVAIVLKDLKKENDKRDNAVAILSALGYKPQGKEEELAFALTNKRYSDALKNGVQAVEPVFYEIYSDNMTCEDFEDDEWKALVKEMIALGAEGANEIKKCWSKIASIRIVKIIANMGYPEADKVLIELLPKSPEYSITIIDALVNNQYKDILGLYLKAYVALKKKDDKRREILSRITKLNDRDAVPALVKSLSDEVFEHRKMGAKRLAEIATTNPEWIMDEWDSIRVKAVKKNVDKHDDHMDGYQEFGHSNDCHDDHTDNRTHRDHHTDDPGIGIKFPEKPANTSGEATDF